MAGENLDIAATGMAMENEIGRGSAQVFREVAPFNWGRIFDQKLNGQYAKRQREKAAEERAQKDMLSRFDKLPEDYWDVDASNIMEQKNELFSKYAGDLKKYGGPNGMPLEVSIANEKSRSSLLNDSELSKQQKQIWKTSYDLIRKEGEKYTPESITAVEIYSHPESHMDEVIMNSKGDQVTVKEEMERTGGRYKFRAENSHLLALDERYNVIDRIGKLAPLVPEDTTTIESVGNMGGKEGTVTKKNVKPSRPQAVLLAQDEFAKYGNKPYAEIDRTFFGNMSPEEVKQYKKETGVRLGLANPDGTLKDEIMALPAGERNERLKKAIYAEAYADMIVHAKKTEFGKTFSYAPSEGGAGKGFNDKFTVAVVPTPQTGGDYQDFNKRYKTNHSAEEFNALKLSGGGGDYVAIEPKGGKPDTESLQLTINGKQVRPIGYTVKDDKVFMTVSEAVPVEEGTDPFGKPIIKYKYKITRGIPVDQEVSGNVSAHYGFETFDAFKGMLEKEITKHGGQEKPAPKVNSWDKYKRKK